MNIQDVDNLASLAKLDLSQDEKEKILSDMEGVLSYVKQIEEIDIKDALVDENDPVEFPYFVKNVWREDLEETRDFDRDIIVGQFPDKDGDFVKVKKIL